MSSNTQIVLNDFGQRIAFDAVTHQTDGRGYIPTVSGWDGSSNVSGPALIRYPGVSGLHPCRRCKCGYEGGVSGMIGDFSDWDINITSRVGEEITYPASGQYYNTGVYASGTVNHISDTFIIFEYSSSPKPYYSSFSFVRDNTSFPAIRRGGDCYLYESDTIDGVFSKDKWFNCSGVDINAFVCSGTVPTYNAGGDLTSPPIETQPFATKVYRHLSSGYIHILATCEGDHSDFYVDPPGDGQPWMQANNFAVFYGKVQIPSDNCGFVNTSMPNLLGAIGSTTGIYNPAQSGTVNYTVWGNGGALYLHYTSGTKTAPSCVSSNPCENCCSTPLRFKTTLSTLNCKSLYLPTIDPGNIPSSGAATSQEVYIPPTNSLLTSSTDFATGNNRLGKCSRDPNKYYSMIPTQGAVARGYNEEYTHDYSDIYMSGVFTLTQNDDNPCKWSYRENPSTSINVYALYSNGRFGFDVGVISSGYQVSGIFEISLERMSPTWYLYKIQYSSDEFTANLFTSYIVTKYKKCGLSIVNSSLGLHSTYRMQNFNPDLFTCNNNGIPGAVDVFLGERSADIFRPFGHYSSPPTHYNPHDLYTYDHTTSGSISNIFIHQYVTLETCPPGDNGYLDYDGLSQDDYDDMDQFSYDMMEQ